MKNIIVKIKTILLGCLVVMSATVFGQTSPFSIYIEPLNIPGLGGIQSYAYGQHNGKWLILGGRLDGLHQRQPFASFLASGNNNQIFVVDPVSMQKWSAPISSLPVALQEQLSSTNMEFHQEGSYLYCVGGYGYSATAGDHITYPNLTAVDVPGVINAVINGGSFTSYFRQISDPLFAVTGGHLSKINSTYYLVGGQNFIGRYNPMGPTHGPGFYQDYTDAIRKFDITDNGTTISINHHAPVIDSVNLHRRDYNVVHQILPDGSEGITAFSGVFQHGVDLPFLNCVNIDSNTYTVNNAFSQYYNHYHCAVVPLFAENKNEMHTLFFGGIAQYYDSLGILVQDNNVPFVKTIARVTRDGSGVMSEYKLPVEMPAYLGAGAEFLPEESISQFANGVLKMDSLVNDTTLLGYIFGGISSNAPNIFFINTGTQSIATSQIFKVFYISNSTQGIHDLNEQSTGTLKMLVYPNPNDGNFTIKYNLVKTTDVKIKLVDMNGRVVEEELIRNARIGEHIFEKDIEELIFGGVYFLTIEASYESATQKLILTP
jgi:hypothetical protein